MNNLAIAQRTDDPVLAVVIEAQTTTINAIEIPVCVQVNESKEKSFPLDVCLATNMIQVGIDVPRLSLMVMNFFYRSVLQFLNVK